MTDRTKEINTIMTEMASSHGAAFLRKAIGPGIEYNYILVTTPSQHIASKAKSLDLKQEVMDIRDDVKIHHLIKRIQQNELAQII
jgi:hypothetical protein